MKKTADHSAGRSCLFAGILALMIGSCTKSPILPSSENEAMLTAYCSDCKYLESIYSDTLEHPSLSGEKIQNPYTIANMTEAYAEAYGHAPGKPLQISHLYVRFTPMDYVQLAALEETDLDFHDQPLDQKTVTEGGLLAQNAKPVEGLTQLYAVVPAGYRLPVSIPYTILESMFIPDDDKKWEDAALKRTGNLDDAYEQLKPSPLAGELRREPVMPIPDNNGALSDGGVSWAANHPSGRIMVRNMLATRHDGNPIIDAQVVVRRLFKVERMRTDANGAFACKKYFRNKYTIIIKFKNELARVSRSRPWNFVEQYFPIKVNFGKWSNLDKGHVFMIEHPTVAGTIATSQWCAAITFDGVQDHRAMSEAMGIGAPPKGLNILLCSKTGAGHGNTFMLNKMIETGLAPKIVEGLVPSTLAFFSPGAATASIDAMMAFKARAADIRYGYGEDPEFLTTDRYSELVYHELSHAAHYGQVGNDWWLQLGVSEAINSGDGYYGDGNTRFAPRIALAEGWAFFLGHFMADREWGMESTAFPEQGSFKKNSDLLTFESVGEMSSHAHFLEAFAPARKEDPDRWIPKGLFWDLMDGPTESFQDSHVVDQVSGLTPEQMFRMLTPDVKSMLDYKTSLLRWYGKGQKAEIIDLLRYYGY